MIESALLSDLFRHYPHQPATAFWRSIELAALVAHGIPHGRGLDLGCGDGILTAILLSRVGRRSLVGIDADEKETAIASRFPFYTAVHTCPAAQVPESTATFDFVLSNSVLEHISELEPVIEEVGRLLRPGGRFVFTVPSPVFRQNLRGPAFAVRSRAAYLTNLDKRLAHFHYLGVDEWRALCMRHGMVLEYSAGYFNRAETQRWELLSRLTGGLLYKMYRSRRSPIEIQRRLNVRSTGRRLRLPRTIANLMSRITPIGVPQDATPWVSIEDASCVLFDARRLHATT